MPVAAECEEELQKRHVSQLEARVQRRANDVRYTNGELSLCGRYNLSSIVYNVTVPLVK